MNRILRHLLPFEMPHLDIDEGNRASQEIRHPDSGDAPFR